MQRKTALAMSAAGMAAIIILAMAAAGSGANNNNDNSTGNNSIPNTGNNNNSEDLGDFDAISIDSNLSLMIPILNKEDPRHDVELLWQYLRPGDIVVFPPDAYGQISELKREIGGLEIGTGGITITTLLPGIQRIPADVEYVIYDYESDFTPEWTTDQEESIKYFKQLYDESHKNNKKLVIVPVFVFGMDWD